MEPEGEGENKSQSTGHCFRTANNRTVSQVKDILYSLDNYCMYSNLGQVHIAALIKDTLNKGHLCLKDAFQCTNLYSGNTFYL